MKFRPSGESSGRFVTQNIRYRLIPARLAIARASQALFNRQPIVLALGISMIARCIWRSVSNNT